MDIRRKELLNQLEAAAKKPVRIDDDLGSLNDALHSLGFQIMYGLPEELQFRAAFHMCERYLPIFEKKQPRSTWVRQLLGDIGAWHRAEGDATSDAPDDSDSADAHYQGGFADLLVGYGHSPERHLPGQSAWHLFSSGPRPTWGIIAEKNSTRSRVDNGNEEEICIIGCAK